MVAEPLMRENVGPAFHAQHLRRLVNVIARGRVGLRLPGDLAVTVGSSGLTVNVGPGGAIIPAPAGEGSYFYENDSTQIVTLAAADATNDRIDAVVAQVTNTALGDGADNTPDQIVHAITGTPASTPTAPATPANAITLRQVRVAHGATTPAGLSLVGSSPTVFDEALHCILTGSDTTTDLTTGGANLTAGWSQTFDPYGFYTGSGVITIPALCGGLYLVSAGVLVSIPPDGYDGTINLSVTYNGGIHNTLNDLPVRTASKIVSVAGTRLMRLNVGDTLQLLLSQPDIPSVGAPGTLHGGVAGMHYFSVAKLGQL